MRNVLENALPIVARSVSEKYDGLEVNVGGNRACTEGSRILIPTLPETKEARLLARGFIDHEAAHVRHTDFSVSNDDLTNALEDIRIEELLSREFPGAKKNLKDLAEHYVRSGKITVSRKDTDQDILGKYVHFKLRTEKLGNDVADFLEAVEKEVLSRFNLKRKIEIDRVISQAMHSTSDAKRMAGELYNLLRKQKNGRDDSNPESSDPGENDRDTESASDQSKSGRDVGSDEGESTPDAGDEFGNSGSDSGSEESDQDDQSSNSNNSNATGSDQDEESSEEQDYSDSESAEGEGSSGFRGIGEEVKKELDILSQDAPSGEGTGSSQGEMLSPIDGVRPTNNIAFLNFKDSIPIIRRASSKMRRKLQCVLEGKRRDDERVSRQGRHFSKKNLHRLALKDTRVFTRKQEQQAPDTAIHFLLDTSGSMDVKMEGALAAGYSLTLALEGMQHVACAVSSYPYMHIVFDELGNPVDLHVGLEEIKKFEDPLQIGNFNVDPHGTTPTDGAMWHAAYTLLRRRESRKMIFVITDGEPDNVRAVQDLEKRLIDAGIEVFGLGINMPRVKYVFRDAINVGNIDELADSLFRTLQNKL